MTRTIKPQALERLKTTYKNNQGLLLPAVQRHVMRRATDLTDVDRRTDIMHPSDMSKADWCPRADFYRITQGEERGPANPSFMMENVFDEGHRIHRKWQGWLWQMGILTGMFQCKDCEYTWWDTSPEKCVIDTCWSKRLRYREVPLYNEELMIAGHADGLVEDGLDWLELEEPVLLEFKSLSIGTLRFEAPLLHHRYMEGLGLDEIWREVKRPFASHIKQGTLYCWLGGFTKIVFIYECKWNQQAKEFVVTANFNHIKDIIESAKDVSDAVRHHMEPYRPHWATGVDGPICQSCPYRKTCWGINENDHQEVKPVGVPVAKATAVRRRKALRKA